MIDIDRVVSFTRKKIEDLEWGTAAQLVIIQRETVLVDLAIGGQCTQRCIDTHVVSGQTLNNEAPLSNFIEHEHHSLA